MQLDFARTTVDLIRHGECEGGKIYRGSTNVNLSVDGWQNMQEKVTWAKENHFFDSTWDVIVSSPLNRCKQFAAALAKLHGVELVEVGDLRETSFGDWEGQLVEDVWTEHKEKVFDWIKNPEEYYPPNGEPTRDFFNRVRDAWGSLIEAYREQHILVVCHGGVMRAILSAVLNSPVSAMNRIDVPYACFSRVHMYHYEQGDQARLVFHNVGD